MFHLHLRQAGINNGLSKDDWILRMRPKHFFYRLGTIHEDLNRQPAISLCRENHVHTAKKRTGKMIKIRLADFREVDNRTAAFTIESHRI